MSLTPPTRGRTIPKFNSEQLLVFKAPQVRWMSRVDESWERVEWTSRVDKSGGQVGGVSLSKRADSVKISDCSMSK